MSNDEKLHDDVPPPAVAEGDVDYTKLRKLSLQPGGFGAERALLWAKLLHAQPSTTSQLPSHSTDSKGDVSVENLSEVERHPDEDQIRKDTDRSFVLYPVGDMKDRDERQQELLELITALFRKRRRLRYFQGYHDIISVLYLTMPKELHLSAIEKMSLHRLRDNMGSGLEPVTGLMRVLKRLLALADPEFAAILERSMPLPFFALSNLLTLCSHDVPTLQLIQHIFDYLLCRPPIYIVYLVAAITLTRKVEVQRLEQEDEEGMIHSVLTSIPNLYDDDDAPEGRPPDPRRAETRQNVSTSEAAAEASGSARSIEVGKEAGTPVEDATLQLKEPVSAKEVAELASAEQPTAQAIPETTEETREDSLEAATTPVCSVDATLVDNSVASTKEEETLVAEEGSKSMHSLESSTATAATFKTAPDIPPPEDEEDEDYIPRRPRVALRTLLERADELHDLYPPTHPGIHLESIMGPQSVVYTWSANASELPDDDEAELMVLQLQLIVLPFVEEPDGKEKEEEESVETDRHRRHRRRRLRKPRRLGAVMVERRAVVASAVLVLGVAMAVYGMHAGPEPVHGSAGRDLRRLSRLFSGFVVGVGGKLWGGLVAMSG